jgi:hypothetical protein
MASIGDIAMVSVKAVAAGPRTLAVRRALQTSKDGTAIADLLFLEAWGLARPAHLGSMLRARQIRRANPQLSDEMNAELGRSR